MKTPCTRVILLMLTLLSSTLTHATDLVVASGGQGGAYSSIAAAIAAAAPNDRIIVYPQPNNASYSEGTITITKSVQILSANEGAFYAVDGNINFTPATAGINVTIIGMKLLTGSIQSTIASPTGARSSINLLNDSLVSGGVSFNHNNYNLTMASSYVEGSTVICYGKLLGNVIYNGQIVVNTDASVNNPNDSVMIIGNKISYYAAGASGGITWHSTSQFFIIENNFVYLTYPGNATNYGIYISNSKSSATGKNTIINNTVHKISYSILYAYTTNCATNSFTEFQNNLYVAPLYYGGFVFGAGNFNVHYNYGSPSFSMSGATNDGTNIAATNTTLNLNGEITNLASNAINGGNPDSAFVDINLSRNDAGCYGGSYTLDNFFPITASDWARVILVTAPRRVLVNGTINVKAIGFDK